MSKAYEIICKAWEARCEYNKPQRHCAACEDRDDDMSWYVYAPLPNKTRRVIAENLYEEDARFIAACYTHVGTLLRQ